MATSDSPAAASLPLLGLTILLVEDSRFAAEALRLICLRAGARLRRAETMAQAERHLGLYIPDCLIVDCGLPDGDGCGLIARLHHSPRRPPVLLGTSGDSAERARVLAAGADGFLGKPVPRLPELIAMLAPKPPAQRPRGVSAILHDGFAATDVEAGGGGGAQCAPDTARSAQAARKAQAGGRSNGHEGGSANRTTKGTAHGATQNTTQGVTQGPMQGTASGVTSGMVQGASQAASDGPAQDPPLAHDWRIAARGLPAPQHLPIPDPLALADDLRHAHDLLTRAAVMPRYVAGFLASIAVQAGDDELAAAVNAFRSAPHNSLSLRALLAFRLSTEEAGGIAMTAAPAERGAAARGASTEDATAEGADPPPDPAPETARFPRLAPTDRRARA